MKFSIKGFFSKCDQIRRKMKKSLMENFIFCAMYKPQSRNVLLKSVKSLDTL